MEYVHSQQMMVDFHEALRVAGDEIRVTMNDMRQPHVLMRPKVYKDGDKWCCLYGDNIQEGVCGFGDTPEEACHNFDKVWWNGDKAHKTREGA